MYDGWFNLFGQCLSHIRFDLSLLLVLESLEVLLDVLFGGFNIPSKTAAKVLEGMVFSEVRMTSVHLAEFSMHCLEAMHLRLIEIALWEYWVTYAACVLMKHVWMAWWKQMKIGLLEGITSVDVMEEVSVVREDMLVVIACMD